MTVADLGRGVHLPPERQPDRGFVTVRGVPGQHGEAVAVHGDHPGRRRLRPPAEDPAVQHQGVGVVVVHVLDDPGGVRAQRVRLGRRVLVGADPAHPAEPADVPHRGDVQPVEPEVGEPGVERARMHAPGSAPARRPAPRPAPRPPADHGHPGQRQRITGAGFGGHQRRPRVRGQVPAVLGQVARAAATADRPRPPRG